MAKPDIETLDDLLTEKAHELIRAGSATKSVAADFADDAALYIFPGFSVTPRWARLVSEAFDLPVRVTARSPCGILAFEKEDRFFALTFSFGHVYLDDAKTEADFGLKVAINAVSDEKLRSVERSNLGAAIRDFAQAAGQRDLRSFGFDDALDLIRKVSGRAEDSEFANMVTGSRPLRFTKKIEISAVPDAALEAIEFFESKAYKKTTFKIIDFLSPVLDTDLEEELDEALVVSIRDGADDFEIAIPEILPENIGSFRFEHAGIREFHPDLSIELYRQGLGTKLAALSADDLKHHAVAGYGEDEDKPFQRWPVYRSLVGSLVLKGERYALNEGHWYRIGKSLKQAADNRFVELCKSADRKFRPFKKIETSAAKGKKPKASYQSEESYNSEIADETEYLLLYRKLIQIEEISGPGIEACDLLDIEGRRFIHVKKSSRQSSVLSHLFKQGGNAAQMLRKYEQYKSKLVEVVRKNFGRVKAQQLEAALKSTEKWTVEFQIADFPRKDGTQNIPFFSKLTLRDEATIIEAMNFKVVVRFIKLTRIEDTVAAPRGVA